MPQPTDPPNHSPASNQPKEIAMHPPNTAVIARIITENIEEKEVRSAEADPPPYLIRKEAVEPLTEMMMEITANVIATILDAGSERDAVMENEELFNALRSEF